MSTQRGRGGDCLLVGNVGQMSIVIHFVNLFINLRFYFIEGQKNLEHEGEVCL
jgi:hypothetical protein